MLTLEFGGGAIRVDIAGVRWICSFPAPTEITRLVVFDQHARIKGILGGIFVHFLLHFFLVSDHVQMVQKEGLKQGSFHQNPEKGTVFNVLQVWATTHVFIVVEALNDEKDILTDENEQVSKLSANCLSDSLLI